MTRIEEAEEAYVKAFGEAPPVPFGVGDDAVADALERAVDSGRRLPADFDFWSYLPPGASA